MFRLAPASFLLLALMVASTHASGATDTRAFYRAGPDGVREIREIGSAEGPAVASDPGGGALRAGFETIWQRHLTDAIFTTTSLGVPSGTLAAATYLNPPKELGVYATEGDGTPDWTYDGTEIHTSSSRDGSVIAAVDYDQNAQTMTVGRWEPGSSAPLWTTTLSPVSRGSRQTVLVSGDGSTIAVLVSMQPSTAARLYLFEPASSVPIGVYDGPGGFGRNLSIGEDGRFIAFTGLATAYVVDRDAGIIRWSGSMGASSDPIAISTDGNYLVYGWTSLRTLQWNGTAYASLWTVSGGAYWLGPCTFSVDGGHLIATWYNQSTYLQNRVQHYVMPSNTPLWTYDYPVGGGAYQDVPYDVSLTPDGGWILVASWGDQAGVNDELHLFRQDAPTPVASFGTAGSVFDADLASDGRGGLLVASCGKAVHANQQGRGGDLFALRYRDPAGIEEPEIGPAALRWETVPNPYLPGVPLCFAVRGADLVRAELFDAGGRHVRTLADRMFPAGRHLLRWDGLDEDGRAVSSGAFYILLDGGSGRSTARLVMIR